MTGLFACGEKESPAKRQSRDKTIRREEAAESVLAFREAASKHKQDRGFQPLQRGSKRVAPFTKSS